MKFSRDEAMVAVEQHNQSIDRYIEVDLAKALGAVDGKIPMSDWFKAQTLIREQGFYQKALAVRAVLMTGGWESVIDMQSNKLRLRKER